MNQIAEYTIVVLLLTGGIFTLVGAIGMLRLPDFYSRLHAPTKATTVGIGAVVMASVIFFSSRGEQLGVTELLITVFLFITAPVSANFLAKAAMHLGIRPHDQTRGKSWDQ